MTGETLHDDGQPDDFRAEHREKLARMAGQIAAFFDAYPDDQAIPAIADHINQFWSRRMRGDFLAAFDAASEELHPLVRKALSLIRPAPAR